MPFTNSLLMTSKEALWFVGKCLSLSAHPERASAIREILQSGQVNWKSVVYQSSNQFVLPALYLNLKRNALLFDLPKDLVVHLEDITNLNRERNLSILNQLENITALLRENGIEPVFLKGTAHLLDGLYADIGERMIGDIDFILEEKEAYIAFQILLGNGYSQLNNFGNIDFGAGRHLPRLVNEKEIAAVEIHGKILKGKYDKTFNWSYVQNNIKKSDSSFGALILSDKNLILNNIMNVQINDNAWPMIKIFLRQSYDLMLLTNRQDALMTCKSFGHYFDKLNTYLALSADLLNYPNKLNFEHTPKVKRYLWKINFVWNNPKLSKLGGLVYFILFRLYRYFKTVILFFINSSTRKRVIISLSDPKYYSKHFEQYKIWFR